MDFIAAGTVGVGLGSTMLRVVLGGVTAPCEVCLVWQLLVTAVELGTPVRKRVRDAIGLEEIIAIVLY